MSFFTHLSTQLSDSHLPEYPTNVLGATGLSRASLRTLFDRTGLFGADSALDHDEQFVVARALGRLPGTSQPTFERERPWRKHRLAVLNRFAEAAIHDGGRIDRAEWDRAQASGVDGRVLSEVLRIVSVVRDVYGLPAPTAAVEVLLHHAA